MNCFICENPTSHALTVNTYNIVECLECGHRMADVAASDTHTSDIYSDSYFFGGGAGYPNYMDEEKLLTLRGQYYGRILSKHIRRPGKVLDVGAASGFILKGLMDEGWKGCGIEPNENMAAYARDRLSLDVRKSTLESFQSEETFDVVSLIQVIAHFIDPYEAMKIVRDRLSQNGFILVETWNHKSLTERILGRYWHEYSPPSVLHWFSPDSLQFLMKQFGFRLVGSGRPSKKIIWKHARSLIGHKLSDVPFWPLVRGCLDMIPDHTTIPYPAEDLFWALFERE